MKLVRWKRFLWDLTKLPPPEAALPLHFSVRPATAEDQRAATEVIFSAFSTDNSWSDTFKKVQPRLAEEIASAFEETPVPLLVVSHGQRIIGASLLCLEIDAPNHLLSGPCVLAEYRSRGMGTALLHASLKLLQVSGLTRAVGICKATALTSKFVYRKFGSVTEESDFEPSLVASR